MKIKKTKYSKKDLKNLLIFPDKYSNKYTRGTCNIVAGSQQYAGAPILAVLAASKSGSGYTKLYTCEASKQIALMRMPSLVCASFDALCVNKMVDDKPEAFVVGPGFACERSEQEIVLKVLSNTDAPVVIDGGAFTSFSSQEIRDALADRHDNGYTTILTPHMGEAKKLLFNYAVMKVKTQEEMALQLAYFTKTSIVLKGPKTYVCDGVKMYEMKSGTPALAKAGSGDVLAGMLGGILCQGRLDSFDACVLATELHAQAGKCAAKELTEISVMPEDVINYIPKAITSL